MGSHRLALFVLTVLLAGSSTASLYAQSNNLCDQPGEKPDMIMGDMPSVRRWGTVGGITAYSLGNTACNIGTCWLNFNGDANDHPVLAQSLYRLDRGRLEQIGQSWVKHFGGALQDNYCGTCLPAGDDGHHLGVLCSDIYDASYNGFQSHMGIRPDVNPHTGADTFPYFGYNPPPGSLNLIDRRLQVSTFELDPTTHPRARYFGELQAIGADDAAAGNEGNNWSYREFRSVPNGPAFDLLPIAPTVIGPPVLSVWAESDPSVSVTQGDLPGDGPIRIATKVTWLGNGTWSYEYAVMNLTSNAAPLAFSVPIPAGVS